MEEAEEGNGEREREREREKKKDYYFYWKFSLLLVSTLLTRSDNSKLLSTHWPPRTSPPAPPPSLLLGKEPSIRTLPFRPFTGSEKDRAGLKRIAKDSRGILIGSHIWNPFVTTQQLTIINRWKQRRVSRVNHSFLIWWTSFAIIDSLNKLNF